MHAHGRTAKLEESAMVEVLLMEKYADEDDEVAGKASVPLSDLASLPMERVWLELERNGNTVGEVGRRRCTHTCRHVDMHMEGGGALGSSGAWDGRLAYSGVGLCACSCASTASGRWRWR